MVGRKPFIQTDGILFGQRGQLFRWLSPHEASVSAGIPPICCPPTTMGAQRGRHVATALPAFGTPRVVFSPGGHQHPIGGPKPDQFKI